MLTRDVAHDAQDKDGGECQPIGRKRPSYRETVCPHAVGSPLAGDGTRGRRCFAAGLVTARAVTRLQGSPPLSSTSSSTSFDPRAGRQPSTGNPEDWAQAPATIGRMLPHARNTPIKIDFARCLLTLSGGPSVTIGTARARRSRAACHVRAGCFTGFRGVVPR